MAVLSHQQDGHSQTVTNQKANCTRKVNFISQNVRGVKSDQRLEELFHVLSSRNILAACLQETWRSGTEIIELNGLCMISNGVPPSEVTSNRGSKGVAIVLSNDGILAWKAGGSESHTDLGPRIVALRLLLKDNHNRDVGVFLVSAYSPVGNSTIEEWDSYFDNLSICLSRKRADDILLIGCDCNSSMGINILNDGDSLGRYGLSYVNNSGKRFLTYISVNNLKAATTCFKKKRYATWIHPRSKNQHQIDHILINKEMFYRCIDAGIASPLLDSDHNATFICLRIMKRLKRKGNFRDKLVRLDYTMLSEHDGKKLFNDEVEKQMNGIENPSYSDLSQAIIKTASVTLPKRKKAQPGWFRNDEKNLMSLIEARNEAMRNVFRRRTRQCEGKLRTARSMLKKAIKQAKNRWIQDMCHNINTNVGTKVAWDTIKILQKNTSKMKPSNEKRLKRPDGSMCQSSEENAGVFKEHFRQLYEREATFDKNVLDILPQTPEFVGCDQAPTEKEIRDAILCLKNKAPGESGIMPQVWKCIIDSDYLFSVLKDVILQFWLSEKVPSEWDTGKLNILPKKGDLSLPKNYRGIMLLETAYKIVAIILHKRLLPIEENIEHEAQCGFRPGRGCMDAIYTVKSAVKKGVSMG